MTTPAGRIAKLRELREAASPGPWEKIGINDEQHAEALEANDAFTAWVYDSNPASDVGGEEVATFDAHDLRQNDANAALAAQAPALAASVEALGAALEGILREFTPEHIDKVSGTTAGSDACEALATIPDLEEE